MPARDLDGEVVAGLGAQPGTGGVDQEPAGLWSEPVGTSHPHGLRLRRRQNACWCPGYRRLCWLALLLTRTIEVTCGDTWPNLRRELDRLTRDTYTSALPAKDKSVAGVVAGRILGQRKAGFTCRDMRDGRLYNAAV